MVDKYRSEKKKLAKLCKVLEEELKQKERALQQSQEKLAELHRNLQASVGLLAGDFVEGLMKAPAVAPIPPPATFN